MLHQDRESKRAPLLGVMSGWAVTLGGSSTESEVWEVRGVADWAQVQALGADGVSQREIARRLG
jgi:hypothetical protein